MNLVLFAFVAVAQALEPSCNIESAVQMTQESVSAQIYCQKQSNPQACNAVQEKRANYNYAARNSSRRAYSSVLTKYNLTPKAELSETNWPTRKVVGKIDVKSVKPPISEESVARLFDPPKAVMADKAACTELGSAYRTLNPPQKVECVQGIVAWKDDPAPKEHWLHRAQAEACCAGQDNPKVNRPNAATCANYGIKVVDNHKGRPNTSGSATDGKGTN